MAPPSQRTLALAARLEGAEGYDLVVADARWVAPWLRELVLSGPLADMGPLAGQDLMVAVGDDELQARWRRYTIESFDAAAGTATLWVSTRSRGPGARWAAAAHEGDRVEVIGPRGKVRLDDAASHHVFVVDDAGIAAMRAMATARPAATTATCLVAAHPRIEGADGAEQWFEDHDALLGALGAALGAARGAAHAYVLCELGLMRAVAARLGAEGLGADQLDAKPYWRADRANEDHGEPDKATPIGEPARS